MIFPLGYALANIEHLKENNFFLQSITNLPTAGDLNKRLKQVKFHFKRAHLFLRNICYTNTMGYAVCK